ncbi:hypothetical protein PYW07_003663 [Mythimna separata]|uniref:PSP proline-rich domain-containing protein n=1 Tax=Mythimna separata TaxID=271217 RepID=A0AAD7YNN9_MYTSE|nr:hypothetical protein PYW07_003663 [Mythimna separata]
MSKRKAGVNDIIYELDNEDIVLSSDDEVKEPKINRLETINSTNATSTDKESTIENSLELIEVDKPSEDVSDNTTLQTIHNGGKMSSDVSIESTPKGSSSQETIDEVDNIKKIGSDGSKTTILNEDIVIDSPGNSDLGVEGCENRTPLVTVRFKDSKMAKNYKEQVKAFMLNLIKLHEGDSLGSSESETDVELDIWPEDLVEPEVCKNVVEEDSNLFFVDTDPCADRPIIIPRYSQASSTVITNTPAKEASPPPVRRGPSCFNCDGGHQLRECPLPRDHARIAEKRKAMTSFRVGRYHVEDEQKYGHLIPGRISGQLRHALGLKRNELPMHIYRMRLLGYPPGWLEEARISHSGITMFDSTGAAILEPEEEEGEVTEPGSKDKFDIKKILDFPGFNVPASSRYIDESEEFSLPPMSEQDSKMSMLQFLAPNAMKAYKRKKLTFFPSASNNNTLEGQAEMDLDSGDETADFPSNPPLPDEAPPPAPPPPPPPATPPPKPPAPPASAHEKPSSESEDLEVIEVIKVGDIPIPVADLITIDEDDEKSPSGRNSPTLDDLEKKKKLLLSALQSDITPNTSIISILDTTEENIEDKTSDDIEVIMNSTDVEEKQNNQEVSTEGNNKTDDESSQNSNTDVNGTSKTQDEPQTDDTSKEAPSESTAEPTTESQSSESVVEEAEPSPTTTAEVNDKDKTKDSVPEVTGTPEAKPGHVKGTLYGTPVMNIASPYLKLPTDDKFAKDICDVINFENLPNSTGKYKKISALLKKVKGEVDRIQES